MGCLLAVLASALSAATAFGEGSVDFNTGENTRWRNPLILVGPLPPTIPHSRYPVFRVYAQAGETIQMGSSAMGLAGGIDDIRVYAPGTDFASASDPAAPAPFPADPVFSTQIFDCNTDSPGTGRIATRAQELTGPEASPDADPDTWTPCDFTAPADGSYPIVMMPFAAAGTFPPATQLVGTPVTTTQQGNEIAIWDVTVRDAGVVQPGRLFSHRLTFSERAPAGLGANSASYLYTPAGYQYRVSLFGHRGQVWDMAANDRGVIDAATGERTFASFQWGLDDSSNTLVHTEALAPQLSDPDKALDSKFPIFFNPTDPVAVSGPGGLGPTRGFAAAPISPSGALTGLSFTGTGGEQGGAPQGSGGAIRFQSPPQLDGLGYTTEIDLNQNGTFGDANDLVDSRADLSSAGNSVAWNGQDANGATPACGTYKYRVRSTLAEAHFTMSDVEVSGGTQIERLSLPNDPALGDPSAASYNDIDPYKGTPVTNTSPVEVNQGTSGPTFHGWSANTGNADFVDTWMRLPEVVSSGTLRVLCPTEALPKPKLKITKKANRQSVRPGGQASYKIVVRNVGKGVASKVRVCDRMPSQLVLVRAGADNKVPCWTVDRLQPGAKRSFNVLARVRSGASGRARNVATVKAKNAKKLRKADASVRVGSASPSACAASLLASASC